MIQKDYINKKYITSRKNKHLNKTNQKLPKNIIFKISIIISICIISLYYLSKKSYTSKKSSLFNKSTFYKSLLPNINTKNNDNLPPKPEERWHYIQELKKKDNDLEKLYHSVKSNVNSNNKNILNNKKKQLVTEIDNKKNNSSIKTLYKSKNKKNIKTSKEIINLLPEKFTFDKKSILAAQNKIQQNYLIIKCLSFKKNEEIESMKANLAFLGLESNIIKNKSDFPTIRIEPYNKETKKIKNDQLKSIDLSNCILL
ncbi:hypothetical protein [Arsenophonus symbiont of Ornithomya chloropus]|uniref:hypothetical protein n=1 Tax=Arsenophonus symbiont of Ornithomya chloropus TaxID=634121 RepID=UPI0032B30177